MQHMDSLIVAWGLQSAWASADAADRLSSCGSQTQLLCSMWDLSSLTRYRICVLCIARQIHYHWATREIPRRILFELQATISKLCDLEY